MKTMDPSCDSLLNCKRIFLKYNKEKPMKSIINLYGALIRKEDFERSKKSMLNKCSYLILDQKFIKNIFDSVRFTELHKLYNEYLGINSKSYSFKHRLKVWIRKCRVPFPILRLVAFLHGKNEIEVLVGIVKKARCVTERSGKNFFSPPVLLKDIIDEKRLYEIGFTVADGTLKNHQQDICDGSSESPYMSKFFLRKLKERKVYLWGLKPSSIAVCKGKERNRNMWKLTTSCKSFIYYINFVYGVPLGKKHNIVKEPEIFNFIQNSAILKPQKAFYRGVFDGDGSASKQSSSINLWSTSKILIKQTEKFLKKLDIQPSIKIDRNGFSLTIKSDDYKKFAFQIGTHHPEKSKTIIKRLKIPPKRHIFIGLKRKNIENNCFNFEKTKNIDTKKYKILLPLKPSKKLIILANYLIPQDQHKLLVMREGNDLTFNEFYAILNEIQTLFNCKIYINPCTKAYFINNTTITQFFRTFFEYGKSWNAINKAEEYELLNKFKI